MRTERVGDPRLWYAPGTLPLTIRMIPIKIKSDPSVFMLSCNKLETIVSESETI
jgi:hypothetical protein